MRFNSFFSLFTQRRTNKVRRRTRLLEMEPLEDRCVPSNTISGYVFQDTNNNGLMDIGELPVGNAGVQLLNSSNQVIATATTNSQGFYLFTTENAVTPVPTSETVTYTFPSTQPATVQGLIAQFDPNLGQLQSLTITQNGAITSDIQVENTSTTSSATISAAMVGSLNLSLTSTGQSINTLNLDQNAGTFNAGKFNGIVNFAGPAGTDFGPRTASGSVSTTLTGNAMTPFIGTGQTNLTETAVVNTNANSTAGNTIVSVNSTATDTITISYNYIPSNVIPPGQYTIQQSPQPAGYFPGFMSSNGKVLSNTPGNELISVTIPVTTPADTYNAPNNDFGELLPASVSGYVYVDANNNGIKDTGETTLANVVVTLTGTNDLGTFINQTALTNASGQYSFSNLRPGTYTVTETQPSGYLEGQNSVGQVASLKDGSLGPNVDQISAIVLAQGNVGTNYNFGELAPGSLSGYVYLDANTNGILDSGDPPIPNVVITLTGTNDQGAINQTATTDSNGFYQFQNLRPGSYTITETQPANYKEGQENAGSLSSTISVNQFAYIGLAIAIRYSTKQT